MTATDWAGVIRKVAPKADPVFVASFADHAQQQFGYWRVNQTKAVAGFLGHAAHETGGFRSFTENMGYSAQRIRQVWPSRFASVAAAAPYARNPAKLANKVYANRMGNGPEASGDGWANRGGGLFQHTGKAEYARVMRRTGHGQDEVRDPARADAMLSAGLTYCLDREMLPALVAGDVPASTKRLNGGQIGLADRRIQIARFEAALDGATMPAARTTLERRDRAQAQAVASVTASGGSATAGAVAETATQMPAPVPAAGPAALPPHVALGLGLALAAALAAVAVWRWRQARREQASLDAEAVERAALIDNQGATA
jgi:putative chitinase